MRLNDKWSDIFYFGSGYKSLRYLMSIGKVEEAKKVLIMYSKLAKKPIDLYEVDLIVGETENASKEDNMSITARVSV